MENEDRQDIYHEGYKHGHHKATQQSEQKIADAVKKERERIEKILNKELAEEALALATAHRSGSRVVDVLKDIINELKSQPVDAPEEGGMI